MNRQEIVDFVEKQTGKRIPESRIEAWHKRGLVPRPIRTSLGRGRGMTSDYPAGSEKQAFTVYELLKTGKNMDDVLFELWLNGFLIDIPLIKNQLLAGIKPLRKIQSLVSKYEIDEDRMFQFFANISQHVKFKIVSTGEDLPASDVELILNLITGIMFNDPDTSSLFVYNPLNEELGEDSAEDIFTAALGLNDAYNYKNKINAGPWFDGMSPDSILELQENINLSNLIQGIDNITDEQLNLLKQDFISIKKFSVFAVATELFYGHNFAGWHIFVELYENINKHPMFKSFIAALLIQCRKNNIISNGMDEVFKSVDLNYNDKMPFFLDHKNELKQIFHFKGKNGLFQAFNDLTQDEKDKAAKKFRELLNIE